MKLTAIISIAVTLILGYLYPISTLLTRACTILGATVAFVLILLISWPRKSLRYALIGGALLLSSFVVAPGRAFSIPQLRAANTHELFVYDGTRYIWGGENRIGIDCSGLIRRALINASLEQSVMTANPRLVRFALSLWWHDCTARDLGLGVRGLTSPVTSERSINALDASKLEPGDLAVTSNGVHILAYAGGNTWVEADPNLGRVTVVRVPDKSNGWFNVPVNIARWQIFRAGS